MLPSILTTFLFAFSAVCATQSTRLLGSIKANFWRLVVATALLAAWAHPFGQGLRGGVLSVFLLSGVIGFGVGDLALYLAYPRLGSRLTILLAQCLAAPFGAIIEWLWLGTSLTLPQLLWGLCILVGVALAIAPNTMNRPLGGTVVVGFFFGVVAALGQAGGAVLSRKAFALAHSAGQNIDGLSAAYQRILAGLVFGGVIYFISIIQQRRSGNRHVIEMDQDHEILPGNRRNNAVFWVILNALAGPALGVGCYQWALSHTPSGIVLPIVATTPLAVIPLAFFLEKERPALRSLLGGLIAVAGAVGLTLAY
jgi:drug/metabolite transporter (DMT)-like permease